ncbi:uncharacterized protein METZ01_LOCUS274724, partial [marine metagenome]
PDPLINILKNILHGCNQSGWN